MGVERATERGGPLFIGHYAVHDEIASGGMATVHLGRLLGPVAFDASTPAAAVAASVGMSAMQAELTQFVARMQRLAAVHVLMYADVYASSSS